MTTDDTPAAEARESNATALFDAVTKARPSFNASRPLIEDLLDLGVRPPAAVIPADTRPYKTQTAALDALPVHTLVSYRDHDGELHTLEKCTNVAGYTPWFETGYRNGYTSDNLVRNEVDYTIVRMGDGS